VSVDQVHPEYGAGQYEVSVVAQDPLAAADTLVLVRETIRALSRRYGLRASFSPKVLADGVGNGGHVHLSLWQDDRNLFHGGDGPYGLTDVAESFVAGILQHLPALLALGAPSVASYLRLIPQHWAGPYQAWGLENREAALRLITGSPGSQLRAANLEVKALDLSANPYLVVAGLVFAGLAGVAASERLPEPVDVDPASLTPDELTERGITRLPTTLATATDAFEQDETLTAAFGPELSATIVDVRRGEIERLADASPEQVAAAVRWRH
jgi:glutamine synthetase